jgi:tetratricopeptide (TPR) repeat protein
MLEESLLIYKNYFSEDHVGLARALENVGEIYKKLGNYEKAKILLEESTTILKKHLPDKYLGNARVLANLGNVYTYLGNYEKAEETLDRSLTIYRKYHYNEKNIGMVCTLLYLGIVHRKRKDYEKAKPILESVLVNYENHYGKDHTEVAQVLKELGQVYLLEGNVETAEKYIYKALNISQLNKHPESYSCLELLSELYVKKSEEAVHKSSMEEAQMFKVQAINNLRKALEIIRAHFPVDSPHRTRIELKLKKLEEG